MFLGFGWSVERLSLILFLGFGSTVFGLPIDFPFFGFGFWFWFWFWFLVLVFGYSF